jgi:Leucine-rich repeat (LRR) protein
LLHLKAFFITGCQIQYTNDLRASVKLTKLKLDHNDLEVDKIGPLPNALMTLDLSFNHLSGLPAVLNGLMNLIFLDLSNNRIESLYGIDGVPALVNLIVDDNLLIELPDSICLLLKLKKLSLARNRMGKQAITRPGQSIPAALLENSELDHIDLSGNVAICKADVMAFVGIDKFLQRRQALSDKNFQGGAMTDGSLFGLD